MVGICGFVGLNDKMLLKEMCNQIKYSPNEKFSLYSDDNINLGGSSISNRYSSADKGLILNEDKSIILIFDGEIYNHSELQNELTGKRHKFNTNSQFEVVVHLYEESGEASFSKLNGIFCLALWDKNKKKLLLVRDMIGVKSLYYTLYENVLLFASEIKSILQYQNLKREVDENTLNYYLTMEYCPTERTLFKGIKKLLPAHVLKYEGGGPKSFKYWNLNINICSEKNEQFYIKKLIDLLKKSVKRRLDTPGSLGAFLSGGMDSSAVVALIHNLTERPIKTFSVSFGEENTDLKYARIVAEYLGTEHHEMVFDGEDLRLLPQVIWIDEEPTIGVVPHLMRKFASRYTDVIFTGRGGDELLGGQSRFKYVHLTSRIHQIVPNKLPKTLHKLASKPIELMARYKPECENYKKYINCILTVGDKNMFYNSLLPGYVNDDKSLLYSNNLINKIKEDPTKSFSHYFSDKNDYPTQVSIAETETRLGELLMLDHRCALSKNIIERTPIADLNVVHFSLTIPAHFKMRDNVSKYILRKSMSNFLPSEILNRKKGGGFAYDVFALINNTPLKDQILSTSSEWKSIKEGYFREQYIKSILTRPITPKLRRHYNLILFLLGFEIWNNIYIEGDSVHKPESKYFDTILSKN